MRFNQSLIIALSAIILVSIVFAKAEADDNFQNQRQYSADLEPAIKGAWLKGDFGGRYSRIRWEKRKVQIELERGVTHVIEAEFRVNRDFEELKVSVFGPLKRHILVTPIIFENISSRDEKVVSFRVRVDPSYKQRFVWGIVNIRSTQRYGPQAVLPIYVRVLDNPLLADDVNQDGVWDFVERHIDENHIAPATRSSLKTYASAFQEAVINAQSTELVDEFAVGLGQGIECVYLSNPEEAANMLSDVKSVLLNTVERSRAYIRFSENASGAVIDATPGSDFEEMCE